MNVHEYQAKALLKKFGVPVPAGELATTPAEAEQVARRLATAPIVVKAQVHAGGRGKAGGIKLAQSPAEAVQRASEILGMCLRTHQTGPEGKLVRKLYVEVGAAGAREFYLAVVLDRAKEKLAVIASSEGGVDIEEVAARSPEKIHSAFVDPNVGLYAYHARELGFSLGLTVEQVKSFEAVVRGLYRLFVELDASLAEINPLVLTQSGQFLALDAKLNFDDNALYRHPELCELYDPEEEDERERRAKELDLAYVGLDGDIGCMVNGAGLAMATLDMIQVCGGRPANFLDVGGGADVEKVTESFKLILRDPNVKAILVNIFGGIVRCDLIAEGVVAAAREVKIQVPLVVRLQGTLAAEGRALLAKSGLNITPAETLREAGEKSVAAARASLAGQRDVASHLGAVS